MFEITILNGLEIPLLDIHTLAVLLFRFMINGFFVFILLEKVYHRVNKEREFLFTFFVFNILIFFVASILGSVKMKTGFAFGLFAIFSILRYRTEQVNIKEMTFLFATIILAVTNSLVTIKVPLVEIFFANVSIVGVIYFLERIWVTGKTQKMRLIFDDAELIRTSRSTELLKALSERTELNIIDYEVEEVNYLRDSANLVVYFQ